MTDCTPLRPGAGHAPSWCIAPEAGFPDSAVLWLWVDGWCFPTRLQPGALHPLLWPPRPALFLPNPLPPIP